MQGGHICLNVIFYSCGTYECQLFILSDTIVFCHVDSAQVAIKIIRLVFKFSVTAIICYHSIDKQCICRTGNIYKDFLAFPDILRKVGFKCLSNMKAPVPSSL